MPPKPGRPKVLSKEQVKEARRLRESGYTIAEIAEEFGVSEYVIFKNTKGLGRTYKKCNTK